LDYLQFVNHSKERLARELAGYDLQPNNLAIVLNRASGAVTSLAETEVHRPRGLSWNAFKVMFILWMLDGAEQQEVTSLADAGRATISAVVKNLVRLEYVDQYKSSRDGRTKTLHLTKTGRKIVREMYLAQNSLLTEWSTSLTDAEQEILRLLLLKLLGSKPSHDR